MLVFFLWLGFLPALLLYEGDGMDVVASANFNAEMNGCYDDPDEEEEE
jgi:hypothetical protein